MRRPSAAPHQSPPAYRQGTNGLIANGMDNTGRSRSSRNRIRLRHEVVCRFHAADTWAVYSSYRLVECLSSLTRAPHTSSGNRIRGLDWYRCGGYRDLGYRRARRLRVATEAALHCFNCRRRSWTQACLGRLRIARLSSRGKPSVFGPPYLAVGSFASFLRWVGPFRCTPNNGHRQSGPIGLVRPQADLRSCIVRIVPHRPAVRSIGPGISSQALARVRPR